MKHIKTILALIGLVAIGFGGGYLLHAEMIHAHLQQLRAKNEPVTKFKEEIFIETGIAGEQRHQIEALLKEYEFGMRHIQNQFVNQRNQLVDTIHQKLGKIELSEEQMQKLLPFLHRKLLTTPFQ